MARRYLAGRAVARTHIFLDDETALAPVSVTYTATREGESAPAVTGSAVSDGMDGWTFNAGQLPEGVYTEVWDGGAVARDTDTFEVVGGFLFTIPELRASDPDLSSAGKYPATLLRAARELVEAEFERITKHSFTPRTRRFTATLDGPGRPGYQRFDGTRAYPNPALDTVSISEVYEVRSVGNVYDRFGTLQTANVQQPDGTYAAGSFYVAEPYGEIGGFHGLAAGTYTLVLSYGYTSVPEDIHRAALIYGRTILADPNSGIPRRATSFQATEGGNFTLATPGRNGYETGIPDVDAILKRYTYQILSDVAGSQS